MLFWEKSSPYLKIGNLTCTPCLFCICFSESEVRNEQALSIRRRFPSPLSKVNDTLFLALEQRLLLLALQGFLLGSITQSSLPDVPGPTGSLKQREADSFRVHWQTLCFQTLEERREIAGSAHIPALPPQWILTKQI